MAKERSNAMGTKTLVRARLLLDAALLIMAITLAIMGFRQPLAPPDSDSRRADSPADAYPKPARYAQDRAKDRGDFKLSYEPRSVAHARNVNHRAGINQQDFECIIDAINERMALPFDIVIVFKDCDEPDASYDDQTHEVTLCYNLIDDYYDLFSVEVNDKAMLDELVRGALCSTLFHEMGHALIDAWNLPITGKEEDAADQISTLMLIEDTEGGEQMALAGALAFKLYADFDAGDKKAYWDEHSLDEQRFYGTLCMVYGHDPEKYAYLITNGTLPESRAELCQEDYAKMKNSWRTLLSPFVKTPPDLASKIRLH